MLLLRSSTFGCGKKATISVGGQQLLGALIHSLCTLILSGVTVCGERLCAISF